MIELSKAQKKTIDKAASDESDSLQGSYTDHSMSAYQERMQREPMFGKEREAFEKAIKKLEKKYGEDQSLADLIELGIDDGFFEVDRRGLLRVAKG